MKNLEKMFYPKSIALIGASDKEGSVGKTISENLLDYKDGEIYFVNPRITKLFNKPVYKSVLEIKKPIDLGIIAVPAETAIEITKQLGEIGCKNILIISAGFNEIGKIELTNKLLELQKKYNLNIIGPNCLGFLNLQNKLDATFNSRKKLNLPKQGNISFISQSGALGIAILDLANYDNLKINKFISYGNAIDTNECDLIEYLYTDKDTDVIMCYIEGTSNGKRFYQTIKEVSKTKKIIVLKGGLGKKGGGAVKSHTAAMIGSSETFKVAVEQAGGYFVESIEEMFNLAKTFSIYKNINLRNIQIITNGGGFGVLVTDQIEQSGMPLAKIKKQTYEKIKKNVPEYAVIKNPIDLTGDATTQRFITTINYCLEDTNVSGIIILFLFQLPGITQDIIHEIINIKKQAKKPIFIMTIGGNITREWINKLKDQDIVCFKDPSDFGKTIKKIYKK